jgi:hypothetical protein
MRLPRRAWSTAARRFGLGSPEASSQSSVVSALGGVSPTRDMRAVGTPL